MNPLFVKRSYLCELVVMSITSGKALLLVLVGRHIGDEPRHCFTKLLADVSVSCNPPVVKRVILNPPWPFRPPPSTSTLTSWQSQLSKQKIMINVPFYNPPIYDDFKTQFSEVFKGLIKTIPTRPHNLSVSFKSGASYCGLGESWTTLNPHGVLQAYFKLQYCWNCLRKPV